MSKLWKEWLTTAEKFPQKTVLIDALINQSITAERLTQKAEQLSEELFKKTEKSIVAFCLPNGIELITFFLAIQKANAIALPLDNTLSDEAQWNMARQLEADYLLKNQRLHRLNKKYRKNKNSCLIKLTSGTSGQSKIIYCSAKNMLADGKQIISTMRIKKSDINLGLIPFGHSYGLGNLIMPLIIQGTTIVTASAFVPSQVAQWIKQYRVTVFPSVPTIFQLLHELPSARSLTPLRLAISAGAPLSPDVAKKFFQKFKLKIHNFYGSSETGGICYDQTGQASLSGRSVGKPLKGVKVKISPNHRIQVKSRSVYCHTFLLRDLGKWNRWKEIELLGRQKPLINIGGKKVDPREIELLLRSEKNISEVWVIPLNEKKREAFALFIESLLNEKKIHHLLQQKLPAWKLPKKIIVMSKLPRTSRGKLDVNQLQKLLQ
jgi:acyl-CoA synthetase (AMP-forming)/AMP-acid ligase II